MTSAKWQSSECSVETASQFYDVNPTLANGFADVAVASRRLDRLQWKSGIFRETAQLRVPS